MLLGRTRSDTESGGVSHVDALGHRLPRRSARRTPAAPSTFRAAAALSRTRKVPAQETGSCCDILLITVGLFGRKLAVMGSSLAKQLPARVRLTPSAAEDAAARCPTPRSAPAMRTLRRGTARPHGKDGDRSQRHGVAAFVTTRLRDTVSRRVAREDGGGRWAGGRFGSGRLKAARTGVPIRPSLASGGQEAPSTVGHREGRCDPHRGWERPRRSGLGLM